ncbi:hypothetical protein ABT076_37240 [Streptomyces sp. NPDC002131]|uniref:hypothetical protein n=1 Tax=unclassified Streptomyces TaxID=2593676 RepID=UPI002255A095|nr:MULTISPECIES: hypothetical protein [unclassified Streptomyces]MCX5134853.1 hypothetical protein [Streptomyces sp. NBC_00340]WSD75803.1 hypothetical protein OHB33_05525 [Streptomyces sp. NBC_01558]
MILGLREDRTTSIPQHANPEPLTDQLRKDYRETLVLRLDPPVACDIQFVPEDPGVAPPRGLVVISVPPSVRTPHAVVGTKDHLRVPSRSTARPSTASARGSHRRNWPSSAGTSSSPSGWAPGASAPHRSESRSRHVAHFHADGTTAWSTEGHVCQAFIRSAGVAETAEGWDSDGVVLRVLAGLQCLTGHAASRAAVAGTATARVTLDAGPGQVACRLASNSTTSAQVVFSVIEQHRATGEAGVLLDAAAEAGPGLVQAAAALLADCFQNFGVVEAEQLTLDGASTCPPGDLARTAGASSVGRPQGGQCLLSLSARDAEVVRDDTQVARPTAARAPAAQFGAEAQLGESACHASHKRLERLLPAGWVYSVACCRRMKPN